MSRSSALTSDSIDASAPSAGGQGRYGRRLLDWFTRMRATAGFGLAALLVYIGWVGRESRDISAGEGLGYWLGIIGGSLMLALLLYSVRKRIPLLRNLGATRHWFRMHMTLGIVGPLIILYHSNFQVGSINSQVALYCTLLVAASGIVGRYFYVQIHNGLYGTSASLRQLVRTVEASNQQMRKGPGLNQQIREQLASLAEDVLQRPETLGTSALAPVWLGFKTRWLYMKLVRVAYRNIDELAASSAVAKQHRTRLRRSTRHYLRKRLAEIRKVAQFGFFERLFSLWHIVHVPFFLMMVLSAIVHVLAVHMY
jgi:hypothetical protein